MNKKSGEKLQEEGKIWVCPIVAKSVSKKSTKTPTVPTPSTVRNTTRKCTNNMKQKNWLQYLEMLEEIDALLETDWAFEMIDCKRMPHAKPYTQKEAEEMSEVLGKIYLIAHCIHCKACGTKYGIGDTPNPPQ